MKRAAELVTPFVMTAIAMLACANISLNPNDRLSMVSVLARLEWRFVLIAAPLVLAALLSIRTRYFAEVTRFSCAALAGLASGLVAAGLYVMLKPTQFGLGGPTGDSAVLASWADQLRSGGGNASPVYPPLQVSIIALIGKLADLPSIYAIKPFQIGGVALMGPVAYVSWRLWFQPIVALFVGVGSSLVLFECYRPYPMLVLIAFIPVVLKLLQLVRHAPELQPRKIVRCALPLGLVLGGMFLLYSGWFQWSAPGFAIATLACFPWRQPRRGVLAIGVSAAAFLLLATPYLLQVAHAGAIRDDFVYFDARVDPGFIAMWKGDLPGDVTAGWPPPGELGGTSLFTACLAFGIGGAIAWGRKRTLVIGASAIFAGTWAFRFYYARWMWQTKLVQLWPRTTAELLYIAMVLATLALIAFARWLRRRTELDRPSMVVGVLAGLTLLFASSTSSIIDKYMPDKNPADPGHMADLALHAFPVDGNQLVGARVEASSSLETSEWSMGGANDQKLWRGYSSELGIKHDHEVVLTFTMPNNREFSTLVLFPAIDGMPEELILEGWTGTAWVTFRRIDHLPRDPLWPQYYDVRGQYTDRVRLRATKLRPLSSGDYVARFADVQLFR